MIEISIVACTIVIVTCLYIINENLKSTADSLRKIASTRSTEIGITVPGNKEVKIELPDGRVATKEVSHE